MRWDTKPKQNKQVWYEWYAWYPAHVKNTWVWLEVVERRMRVTGLFEYREVARPV